MVTKYSLTDNCYRSFSSFFANRFEVLSKSCVQLLKFFKQYYVALACEHWHRLRSLLNNISTNYAKPPEHLLPAKQATCITVDSSSSGFNVTFLHDWSNFDLSKLMLIEHISFNAASWLFLTNASYLWLSQSGIFWKPRSAEVNKWRFF